MRQTRSALSRGKEGLVLKDTYGGLHGAVRHRQDVVCIVHLKHGLQLIEQIF